MATNNAVLIRSYEAAEDLSVHQYKIVVLDTGKVRLPRATTDIPLGVLQNAPVAGEAASVMLIGVSKIQFGETVAANKWVKLQYINSSYSDGRVLDADMALDLAIGRCLVGGDGDELGEILLSGAVHQVNAAS
jgi:hypothetical protein